MSDTLTYHFVSKSYKETVTLIIGTTKERYVLHKDLLCFYSDFFRAAFNSSFKEATEREIELPDTEIEVFEAFQVWLYTQDLPQNEALPTSVYLEWPLLIKLWVFGDRYQIPLLQNNAIDAITDKANKDNTVPIFWINLTYENTVPGSRLRKAITDIMVYRSKMPGSTDVENIASSCLQNSRYWPKEACLDVMAEMSLAWKNKAPRFGSAIKKEKCHYHVHYGDEHC